MTIEAALEKAVAAIEAEADRVKGMNLNTRMKLGECLDDKNNPSMREILVALKALGVKFGDNEPSAGL